MKDLFIEVSVMSYSEEAMYNIFRSMPFDELLKEYSVTLKAFHAYLFAGVCKCVGFEYLDGVIQIMRIVICERVTPFHSVLNDGLM